MWSEQILGRTLPLFEVWRHFAVELRNGNGVSGRMERFC